MTNYPDPHIHPLTLDHGEDAHKHAWEKKIAELREHFVESFIY